MRQQLRELDEDERLGPSTGSIVDAAVDFILFVRRDGIVEFVNHVDSSGSIEDVVGRHVLDFWPKKETERIRGYFDAVFGGDALPSIRKPDPAHLAAVLDRLAEPGLNSLLPVGVWLIL